MSFEIRFLDTSGVFCDAFECGPSETVLAAMERQQINGVPVGCRGGGCGVCKVRVITGDYRTGKMSRSKVSENEERTGCALACRLYPESSLMLEALGKFQQRQSL